MIRMDLQLPMESVPIITKVVGSNPADDDVYSIQHYVIKFVSDLRQVCGFSRYSGFLLQYNWLPQYKWAVVESGIKHNTPNFNLN